MKKNNGIITILVGIGILFMSFIFSSGYDSKIGLIGSIPVMDVVLKKGELVSDSPKDEVKRRFPNQHNEELEDIFQEYVPNQHYEGRVTVPLKYSLSLSVLFILLGTGMVLLSTTKGNSVLQTKSQTSQTQQLRAPPSISVQYAGFWFRAVAAIIDGILCQVTFVLLLMLLSLMLRIPTVPEGYVVFGLLIQWLWFTFPESSEWQATLGKKMLGLRVTDEQGGRISFGRANARYWSKILSALILFIGFIMVAFTDKKQGLHDKIAGTLVLKANA